MSGQESSSELSVMPCGQDEKYLPGAEQPLSTIVDGRAPGEPPSPSPSHLTCLAIRKEPGNLCLHETAWWGWEDSNF
jgi:hypothetical protein